jgi:hypothetical protein
MDEGAISDTATEEYAGLVVACIVLSWLGSPHDICLVAFLLT